MTNISSITETAWSKFERIGFRFAFVYFSFIIFFQNNGAYPFFGFITEKPSEWLQKFGLWFGESVLSIPYEIKVGLNGSGDTTYDYLIVLIGFLTAILGALVWSILDRKRKNYTKMYYWLATALRYYVGMMLISYGMVKVIQLQFSPPAFYRLVGTYGDSSPMGLAWTFLGFSKGYNMFMGIAEILAGLLLFRRTLTFGAMITLMTALNVMMVNYFYDVPVKILSTHLVVMSLFLLSKDIKKVIAFFFTSKPISLTVLKRPPLKKGVRIALNTFKGLLLIYVLGFGFFDTLDAQELYGSKAPKPPLYGLYEVSSFVVNGDTLTDYRSNKIWKNIRFERVGSVRINKLDKERLAYKTDVDTLSQKIRFTSYKDSTDFYYFNYKKTDSTLNFHYIYKNDTVSGKTKRYGKEDFLLTNRGFHWINESPFNR